MLNLPQTTLDALQIGSPQPIRGEELSAIFKEPVSGPLFAGFEGFVGDTQVDRKHHGGVDKAIHFYASNHYAFWQERFPEKAGLFTPGSFGENLVAYDLTEDEVCLGDQYACGNALLEVSQGRQPCWKLAAKFGLPKLALEVEKTGRTGFYCRVIKEGHIRAGDTMALVARPNPDWALTRVRTVLYGKGQETVHLAALAALSALSASWRETAHKKLENRDDTDPNKRLYGL